MTTRTWHGTGNASNPSNWSPAGIPQAGDTLSIETGTMSVIGSMLPDHQIFYAGGSDTINLVGENTHLMIHNQVGSVTINAYGNNELSVFNVRDAGSGSVTINNHGTITGTLAGFCTNYTLNGGTFNNNGWSTGGMDGQQERINADVVGTGTWWVSSYRSANGTLEFMKSVGSGQTVDVSGGMRGASYLEIDQPTSFKASVDLSGSGAAIDLKTLFADSYSWKNGVLDLFSNHKLAYALRLTDTSGVAFGVSHGTSHGTSGIEIYTAGAPHHGADLLHV